MINKERLLSTFLDYVRIDSESKHEGAIAARIAADMEAIGCQIYVDNSGEKTGSETGNLYCTLPATGEGEPIILSAHMDTVVPGIGVEPVVEDGIVRSKGETVLGSDDKSGVVAIVEAMRTIAEKNIPHPTIQAVFTTCEEIGLLGSGALEFDKLAGKKALILDSGGQAGLINTQAPGQYKIFATIVGRRAHAGGAPELGISAIQVAAEAIANMKLLRIDEETTANIGSIVSDFPTNIVPERLELIAEARSRNAEKLETQVKHMMDCLQNACDKYGATLESRLVKLYEAYCFPSDDPFIQEVSDVCRKQGFEPVLAASGGGSDANILNANGFQALVLGTGMDKVHTIEEQIAVKDLENTAALVLALCTK